MQVLPDIHQIPMNYKGRPLKVYLLFGPELRMLMDCGGPPFPDSDILPYFASINFSPASLTHVMATHPDVDHIGGLHRMKEAAPQAKFVCGTGDRQQVEAPEGLVDIRGRAHFYWHGIGPEGDARLKAIANSGGPVPIDQTFAGGETLRWDHERYIDILHLPGHSHGHLGVYIPWENAAIIGDAVHGTANRFLDGRPAFAPTYMYVDEYLGTIERLRAMKLDKLYSCHWPDCVTNAEVESFLVASRDYALRAEAAIGDFVKAAGPAGVTLKEVCVGAKPRLGDWPAERDMDTRSMACGHLQHLTELGLVEASKDRPTRYTWNPIWRGLK